MRYRPLGGTGMQISELGIGGVSFGQWGESDDQAAARIIHRAIDEGINFIDTSDAYSHGGSEEIIGKALSGGRREHVVLATKFHLPGDVAWNEGGGRSQYARQRPALDRAGGRSQPQAATDGLDRSLPGSQARTLHRLRRDAVGADRSAHPGEDPGIRDLEFRGTRTRRIAMDVGAAPGRSLRQRAGAVLDGRARDRAARDSRSAAALAGAVDLEPVGRRVAVGPLAQGSRSPHELSCRSDTRPLQHRARRESDASSRRSRRWRSSPRRRG